MKIVSHNGRVTSVYDEHAFDWKKNEKDEYVCMNCGKSLAFNKRLRTYCSDTCRREYMAKVYWDWCRVKLTVFERDYWICKICGSRVQNSVFYVGSQGSSANGFDGFRNDIAECDHIVPLFLGGKDWHEDLPDLKNFQTLCRKCHKKKSAYERMKAARKGREVKIPINPFVCSLEDFFVYQPEFGSLERFLEVAV